MIKMSSSSYPVAFNCFCSYYRIVDYDKTQWKKHVLISNGKQLMFYMYLIFIFMPMDLYTMLQALCDLTDESLFGVFLLFYYQYTFRLKRKQKSVKWLQGLINTEWKSDFTSAIFTMFGFLFKKNLFVSAF